MQSIDAYFVGYQWFATELNLSGCEYITFAIIYGFSQDGETEFKGSLSYLEKFTGASRSTIQRSLSKLIEKKLIIKKQETYNGVVFPRYSINASEISRIREQSHHVQNEHPQVKMNTPQVKMNTNNIVDNIEEKKVINSSKDSLITKESDEMKWIIPMVQPKSTARLKTSQTYSSVFTEETRQTLTTQEEDSIEEAVSGYVEMRKAIKKPATAKALRLAISKAWSLSSHSVSKFIDIIDQSTMNSWQGVFPIREQGNARAGNLPDYSDDEAISKEGFKTV